MLLKNRFVAAASRADYAGHAIVQRAAVAGSTGRGVSGAVARAAATRLLLASW